MNRGTITAASLLAVALLGTAAAAEPPTAKGLLERAIEVHGGRGALAPWPSLESRGVYESTGRGGGRTSPFSLWERGDGAYRMEVTFEFRGRKVTMIELYDTTIHKRKFGTGWDDLPLDEAKERAAHRLDLLLAALDRSPKVVGEEAEDGVDCWKVSFPDGRGSATLWLAKDDGRLVAMEYPAVDAGGMGTKEEVVRRLVFRDLRRVGKLLLPFDVEWTKDGKPDGRFRAEVILPIAAWDDGWLALPDPRRRFIPPDELAN